MFINIKENVITVNSYRNPNAMSCSISDMLEAIDSESGESLVISVEGVIDALEDGVYLSSLNASRHAIEELHYHASKA